MKISNMKQVFTLALVCLSCLCYGQRFEVSAGAGMAKNNLGFGWGDTWGENTKGSPIGLYRSLTVAVNVKKWQFGIDVAAMPISERFSLSRFGLPGINAVVFSREYYTQYKAKPLFMAAAVINRVQSYGKVGFRYGVHIGYARNKDVPEQIPANLEDLTYVSGNDVSGWVTGAQIALDVKLIGRVSTYAQAKGSYLHISDMGYNHLAGSLSAGVRVKL